ncbi:MAG TPA: hypothetical protein PK874_00720 [Desulfobacteraceae bacterium]|nr:hypothetical protein [Desulfobacteraceae bacterium]HPJ68229.1 hypothetical protein [Desulfobacteraceae bacterium]HPQ26895.1 hypothetical protein [Desulfobacteraceae bacterium]
MEIWAGIVLLLALVGTVINLLIGTPVQLVLHDILLFLITLGILVRIRYKRKEGEKEKLIQRIAEADSK